MPWEKSWYKEIEVLRGRPYKLIAKIYIACFGSNRIGERWLHIPSLISNYKLLMVRFYQKKIRRDYPLERFSIDYLLIMYRRNLWFLQAWPQVRVNLLWARARWFDFEGVSVTFCHANILGLYHVTWLLWLLMLTALLFLLCIYVTYLLYKYW